MKRPHDDDDGTVIILTLITSNVVLATILSPLWRMTAKLALVCKRFAAVVKMREFWMPIVRVELKKRFTTRLSPALFSYINPFFRFPPQMWMCPKWPWWTFLQWMINQNRHSNCSIATFSKFLDGSTKVYLRCAPHHVLEFAEYTAGDMLSTRWYSLPLAVMPTTAGMLPFTCRKTEALDHSPYTSEYAAFVNQQLVWIDGPVHDGRHWCGAATTASGVDGIAIPLEEYGFYRN